MGFYAATKLLAELGQSVWYDSISRDLYRGPELKRLIAEDGLRGMTSNPSIFQKALADSSQYDDDIRRALSAGKNAAATFEDVEVQDVCGAADLFRPLFESSHGGDGFVSIEVSPGVAGDTDLTLTEARRLWTACARPNVMVKIPATDAGIPAIRQCLTEGININITLLFSVGRYREVMEAYLAALEARVQAGQPLESVHSVASFFVSRVDTMVDKRLDEQAARGNAKARVLHGKIGIANAQLAYHEFEEVAASDRFRALRAQGARLQKPLWASTSTKDPAFPPLYYAEALVAPHSIDTMTPETFAAYREQGKPKIRIYDGAAEAHRAIASLQEFGIDFAAVGRDLETEGIKKFGDAYDGLLKTLAKKRESLGLGR